MSKAIVIAIDGYSSCGKSSFAKQIAKEFAYVYVDSGAMYRAVTLYFLNHNGIISNAINKEILSKLLDKITIDFYFNSITGKTETLLNGVNVEEEIRSLKEVADNVSLVSAVKEVRFKMVEIQKKMGEKKAIVMDGRDIGTVVFPNAELKIFMTADPDIRAQRRYKELIEKGITTSVQEIKENLLKRDYIDQNREESPLKKPEDAIILDNSYMTPEQQMEWVRTIILTKIAE